MPGHNLNICRFIPDLEFVVGFSYGPVGESATSDPWCSQYDRLHDDVNGDAPVDQLGCTDSFWIEIVLGHECFRQSYARSMAHVRIVCTEQRNLNAPVSRNHDTHTYYEQVFEGFHESSETRLGHKLHQRSTRSTTPHTTQIMTIGVYRTQCLEIHLYYCGWSSNIHEN